MTLDPLEDGREEFDQWLKSLDTSVHPVNTWDIWAAWQAAWTARAARERELRQIVADLRAHNIQGPSDVTGPVSDALNHVADRIEAALSETQPEEKP